MNKVYTRINWKNAPSEETPLNEVNLNRLDYAVNEIDNRIIEQETTKVNVADIADNIKSWTMDEETGVITIEKYSGEQVIFDLNIEKIPVNFSMSNAGVITMTTSDGTSYTADIGSMIPILTFSDSDQIAVTTTGTGINKTYSFSIKTGSITSSMLEADYAAAISVANANMQASVTAAATSATSASESASSAATSATNAAESETNASASATAASSSATSASTSATLASQSATSAATSAENASASETNAATSENNAHTSETNAATSEANAATSEANAETSETNAENYSLDAQAWAEGKRGNTDVASTDPQYHNNAKYWAEQASQAAGGGVMSFNGRSGAVTPQIGDYTAAMVGLGNVGNFKAVSTVANQGLSASEKSNAKANIGLNNVDNTSDLDKPISTATNARFELFETNTTAAFNQVASALGTKLTTPQGTQGQVLGYTADNVVGAMDAPKGGVDDDDPWYLLNGGFVATSTNFYKYYESLFSGMDSVSVTVVEQTSTNGKRIKTTIPAIIE